MQTRWVAIGVSFLLSVCFVFGQDDDEDYDDPTKACTKFYPDPVENICHENFPKEDPDKTWYMLFSSHACYHCKFVEQGYIDWAKKLKNDPSIRVGVVNCYWAKNYNDLCFPRHGVDALPTLRIIENGTFKVPREPRHNMQQIDDLIKNSLKKRASCSDDSQVSLGISDSLVVPLCRKRFPEKNTKDTKTLWTLLYYTKSSAEVVLSAAGEVSMALGTPLGEDGPTIWSKKRKRERLLAIQEKYGITVELPQEGLHGSGVLANVGAVCCDCNSDQEVFCKEATGTDQVPLPGIAWFEKGEQRDLERLEEVTGKAILEYVLDHLGVTPTKEEL